MPSTLDNQPDDRGIFALFKGDSGAGKSVGALSWPNPYVFDFDRKMPNIALKHFPGKEINYDTFDNVFDVQTKLTEFGHFCPYETLISDSLTTLVVTILNTMGQIKGDDPVAMMRNMKPTKSGGKQAEMMGFDYYNAETNFIERYWLDELKKLWAKPGNPRNIIIIAHVMTITSAPDITTKIVTETRRVVTAGRAVAAYVPTQFDDTWHFAHEMDMDGRARRVVLTENLGIESAKTSFRLPYKIDFTGTPPLYEDGDLYTKFRKIITGDISV